MTLKLSVFAAVLLAMTASVLAQNGYTPDIGNFTGKGDSIILPPDSRLSLADGGTIEFWVRPGWTSDPGYDPFVLSNAGEKGVSYAIAIAAARDALVVIAGNSIQRVAYNFADARQHFVAVSDYRDKIMVFIDNRAIAALPMRFEKLPSSGFFIGSADGSTSPFVGQISAIRLWAVPVDPDVLGVYAISPLIASNGKSHPDIDALIGTSTFPERSFALVPAAGLNSK